MEAKGIWMDMKQDYLGNNLLSNWIGSFEVPRARCSPLMKHNLVE